jgi:uncharacterized protein YciI
MLSIVLALTILQQAPEKPKYDMQVRQLVFLVTPEKPVSLTKEEVQKKQMEHLKYLEGLWKEGKALMVGPLQDAGKYRGLILLDVKTKEEAEALMSKDPYVLAGAMGMETHGWFVARNVPQKGPKFLDIEPLWFGFLKRNTDAPKVSDEEAKEIQAGHMANINKMAESGDLVLAGPVADGGDFRGIFIFRTPEKEKIMELASHDPAINKNRLKLELFRWYTAKGTFPKQP